jgi:peptidoglycan/LPS O-acetylase OafA/YrhL
MSTYISPRPSYDYIPALDGLRACAILFVLGGHFAIPHIPPYFGVTLFFFISGFLITRLLLTELMEKGTVSLYQFYMRRALRLYPSLLFTIFLTMIFYYYVSDKTIPIGELTSALFYFANYYGLYIGYDVARTFIILWSLAVEEHFYLIFPLIFLVFSKNLLRFLKILIIILILILVWRLILVMILPVGNNWWVHRATDARADSILYGCIFSIILATDYGNKFIEKCSKPVLFLLGTIIIFLCFIIHNDLFRGTFNYSLQGFALLLIFPTLLFSQTSKLKQLLESFWLRYIGKLSYSLYLQHWTAHVFVRSFVKSKEEFYIAVILTTITLTLISYHLIERPIIKLRRYYGSHRNLSNA